MILGAAEMLKAPAGATLFTTQGTVSGRTLDERHGHHMFCEPGWAQFVHAEKVGNRGGKNEVDYRSLPGREIHQGARIGLGFRINAWLPVNGDFNSHACLVICESFSNSGWRVRDIRRNPWPSTKTQEIFPRGFDRIQPLKPFAHELVIINCYLKMVRRE